MTTQHPPNDRDGNRVRVGDVVRIVGVPDLSGMSKRGLEESLPVFQHLVGKYKRIIGFDDFGCVQFVFGILRGKSKGVHTVSIEPYLLAAPKKRSNRAFKNGRAEKRRAA